MQFKKSAFIMIVASLGGFVFAETPATLPSSARVGPQLNEWLGIHGTEKAPEVEIKKLLLTPAVLTASEQKEMIAHLVTELNAGVDAQEMYALFARGMSIPKKFGDKNPDNMIGPLAKLVNDLAVDARDSAANDPIHSYQYIRAAFLLSCYEEVTKITMSGSIVLGRVPEISKLLKFDQPDQMPKAMRDSFTRWDEQMREFSKTSDELLLSPLIGPISEKPTASFSKDQSDAMMKGFKAAESSVHDLAFNKWQFANLAADSMRLVRARKNMDLEQRLSAFLLDLAASTNDVTYSRWLKEAQAVDSEERGPMVGTTIMIRGSEGTWVPGERDASGNIVEKKK